MALFFRPDEDQALQYSKHWLEVAIQDSLDRGFITLDMADSDATKEKLTELMANEEVTIAILTGHGNARVFTGFEQQVVLEVGVNEEIMAGTISHFLSCSVGQELLPALIEKGAISTIGYQVDFEFMIDPNSPIEDDEYAEPFKEITVAIIRAILAGKTLREVWEIGIAKCNEWLVKLQNKTGTNWAETIDCIINDRDGMIGLGELEAYVLPPRKIVINLPQAVGLLMLFGWIAG